MLLTHVLAVLGLGLLCGGWVWVQMFVRKRDPDQPGVEGWKGCGHDRKASADACETCAKTDCADRPDQ